MTQTDDGPRGVYLCNLSTDASVSALLKKLQDAAGGDVKASFFREEQTFGYVQFGAAEHAAAAIAGLNGTEFHGQTLSLLPCARVTPGREMQVAEEVPENERSRTLVLKNLPFSLPEPQLGEILNKLDPPPKRMAYHRPGGAGAGPGAGLFRGIAFADYGNVQEASKILPLLNGMEIGGRKIRCEYKRRPKGLADYEPQDAVMQSVLDRFEAFVAGDGETELHFEPTLTSFQRKVIHAKCGKHGIFHESRGEALDRHVVVSKVAFPPKPKDSGPANTGSGDYSPIVFRSQEEVARLREKERESVYTPPRQPRGPDGSAGFQTRRPDPVPAEGDAAADGGDAAATDAEPAGAKPTDAEPAGAKPTDAEPPSAQPNGTESAQDA